MRSRSKRKIEFAGWLALAFGFLPISYFIGALILGLVSSGNAREEVLAGEYHFFACDNGVHVDLVLPVLGGGRDWREIFPVGDFAGDVSGLGFVNLGWGARRFYLETPRWVDLRPGPALLALFSLDRSVLHVTYRDDPLGADNCVALATDAIGRNGLFAYLDRTLGIKAGRQARREAQWGYGPLDAFYAASGTWSILRTCNAWSAGALAAAGQPTALWSPFSFQVMGLLPENP